MKVLVTGSSGRVGRRAVDALLSAGHKVRGFDRHRSAGSALGSEEYTGFLQNAADVSAAVDGVDAVLHLGALMSWSPGDRTEMFETNVDGTRVLLQAAAETGVRRFVFASSGEVYPENMPRNLPLTEDHPLHPNSPYGLTKLLGEEIVRFFSRTSAVQTVILRLSHTQDAAELLDEDSFFSGPRFFLHPRIRQQDAYGNHENADLLRAADPGCPAHVLARNGAGRPYMMHITDTRDAAAGLLLALEHKNAPGGTFNLGATEPVDFADFLGRASGITGYPVVPVDFPGAGVHYRTSNELIRTSLGYEPRWTIDRMLNEAARARQARAMG